MKKLKYRFNSVRVKLFFTLGIVVTGIIIVLILLNNVVLESFYLYSKRNSLRAVYEQINRLYSTTQNTQEIEEQLKKYAINNNFDILVETEDGISMYTSDRNFLNTIDEMGVLYNYRFAQNTELVYGEKNMNIRKIKDKKNEVTYMLLSGKLDNNYTVYIRLPISSVQESVRISNNFLYLIGGFTLIIAAIMISFISKRFTEPIMELNEIAKKMSKLDFSQKYDVKKEDDEINTLGQSINIMSDKLEVTIQQLRNTNIELERDIEEKSKIDEMRKQFISDVSHELKTPIALIQGYAEGLVENVNYDEEGRKFYAEVILDEANKMDLLVKQLLELMKLEYGKREFNNKKFNVTELIQEVIRKSKVMLEEQEISVKFSDISPIFVNADDFYIEQVITNYVTNAIKHVTEVNGEKYIEIKTKVYKKYNKIRISVFNTGENISDENLNRIWQRFYKIDSSRNRNEGGTGIGLSIVKAIMNNYNNRYGAYNKENGVEFYFELDMIEEDKKK